ncbi:MAG TPA: 4Fe-4S dicluster domain-containing protein [Anaeromyxobacteraceae bacterium]|nr:4Fe-4S dicluster domain-containing protein [Anaeromyxobacteraceae bacterium]
MGHLGYLKQEYRALVRRLDANQVAYAEPEDPTAWQGWKEILEILYTPEEAALAARLPVRPSSLAQLESRLGIPSTELQTRLGLMCEKGVVMDLVHPRTGEVRYLLSPPIVGFIEFSMMRAHDSIPKKRMAEALDAYTRGDAAFAREAFGGETVIGRAVVHESAVAAEVPEVLDWERASAIIADASLRGVSLCFCRHKAEHLGKRCDTPIENCLSLNGGAEHAIRRGFARAVECSEALEILKRARERGLVQLADNVMKKPAYICNCCGCCCEQLAAINRYGLAAVTPSGFIPARDDTACKGCSKCARACPIAAVTMIPRRVDASAKNRLLPLVDEERCIGCGVCADTCRNHALTMKRAAARPSVPANAMERVVRMALERGHLAQLLFDEGASRGAGFLGNIVGALARLGPVQKAAASDALKSRFVRYALGQMRGAAR